MQRVSIRQLIFARDHQSGETIIGTLTAYDHHGNTIRKTNFREKGEEEHMDDYEEDFFSIRSKYLFFCLYH